MWAYFFAALTGSIVTHDGVEVCDGAHSVFVRLKEAWAWPRGPTTNPVQAMPGRGAFKILTIRMRCDCGSAPLFQIREHDLFRG
jgi:hypothetical protein